MVLAASETANRAAAPTRVYLRATMLADRRIVDVKGLMVYVGYVALFVFGPTPA